MGDKSIELANEIGKVLSGHEMDDVMPALAMILAHAASMTDISKDDIVKFIDKAIRIECDEHTRH
jgi:hypothetical protein